MASPVGHSSRPDVLFRVETSTQDRGYWLSRPFVTDELRNALASAAILIVPREGFRDHVGPVFPVGTEDVFHHLRQNAPADATVNICIDDKDYHELALHGALLIVGAFFATALAAPVAVNLISDYFKKRLGSSKDRAVKVELTVSDASRTAKLTYEGPAEHFQAVVGEALRQLPEAVAPAIPPREEDDDS